MSREPTGPEQLGEHAGSGEQGARERILAASRDLFAGGGFDAVSIREIAEAAGVNSALIYYYFQDKEGLYRQVLEFVFGRLLLGIREALGAGEGSPEAMLRKAAGMYVRFIEENQGNLRLMYYELARGGPNLPVLAGSFMQEAFTALRRVVERGMAEGAFRSLDPSLSVISLVSMLLFYFIGRPVLVHILGSEAYTREGVDAFFEHTMLLFAHGLLQGGDASI